MEHLSKLGIGGKGTIHLNKTEKAPLIEPQAKKKKPKVAVSQVLDETSGESLVRQHDNSIITVPSNCFGMLPMGTAK